MKTLLITLLLSISIFGQSGKSVLTQAQKDSIIALYGSQVVDASLSGYETLSDAITTIGSNDKTLTIKDEQDLGGVTIPSNISLKFTNGGLINFTSVCTLKCQIEDADREIFTGITPIIYNNKINPIWFGADRTGANDSYSALQSSFDCLPLYGGKITLKSGYYNVSETLRNTKPGVRIIGDSPLSDFVRLGGTLLDNRASYLMLTNPNDTLLIDYATTSAEKNNNSGIYLLNVGFADATSDTSGKYAIVISGRVNPLIEKCLFTGFASGTAVFFKSGTAGQPASSLEMVITPTFRDNIFNYCYKSIDFVGHVPAAIITGGRVTFPNRFYTDKWAGSTGFTVSNGWKISDIRFDGVDTIMVIGGWGLKNTDRTETNNFITNIDYEGDAGALVLTSDTYSNTISENYLTEVYDYNEYAYGSNIFLNNRWNANGFHKMGSVEAGFISTGAYSNGQGYSRVVIGNSALADYNESVVLSGTVAIDSIARFYGDIYHYNESKGAYVFSGFSSDTLYNYLRNINTTGLSYGNYINVLRAREWLFYSGYDTTLTGVNYEAKSLPVKIDKYGNLLLFGGQRQGGNGVLTLKNAGTAPTAYSLGQVHLWVQSGKLRALDWNDNNSILSGGLSGSDSFDSSAVVDTISNSKILSNDIFVIAINDATPVADDLLSYTAENGRLLIFRVAGTTSNLKYSYIRLNQ